MGKKPDKKAEKTALFDNLTFVFHFFHANGAKGTVESLHLGADTFFTKKESADPLGTFLRQLISVLRRLSPPVLRPCCGAPPRRRPRRHWGR